MVRIVQDSGVKSNHAKPTVSIIIRGANNMILDETERSLHDALCVIRCLVKERGLVAGGGASEVEIARVDSQRRPVKWRVSNPSSGKNLLRLLR